MLHVYVPDVDKVFQKILEMGATPVKKLNKVEEFLTEEERLKILQTIIDL